MAEYSPEAAPERQPAIATLLPTGLGGFSLAAVGIVAVVSAAIAIGIYEPGFGAAGRAVGGRFARSIAGLSDCFDVRTMASFTGWLSQLLLVTAAIVSLVVRLMRRHRRDDYRGRYRAWGWLAGLLMIASCTAQFPLGRLVGTFLAEATGIAFGPAGLGWWVTVSAIALGAVTLWAVLPLHERLATALWLAAGLAAWGGSVAATWVADGRASVAIAAHAAWVAGSGLIAIAMLAAARSVIREVRGIPARTPKQKQPAAATVTSAPRPQKTWQEDAVTESTEPPADAGDDTGYTDGSDSYEDRDMRHLSKSERKRLRKLARMSRVA